MIKIVMMVMIMKKEKVKMMMRIRISKVMIANLMVLNKKLWKIKMIIK
jgi:hypothetical protein